jgi:ATP-dependent helicase HrpA
MSAERSRQLSALDTSTPSGLPIAAHRDELIALLARHRVIVVCGDTGSGKTTQLPKICLAAGLGQRGMIGHTQPRRIAARAVATRLASELGSEVGAAVGLKIRFTDRTAPSSLVKVMTDGILLNEIREDRWLEAYDALIIDEAHERSVNIDFLLGYLKRIERRRPDLKVIVTSATLDPEKLAAHFLDAPILRIEGRSYPVALRYRPPAAGVELPQTVVEAVRELAALDVGELGGPDHRDVLVFLPGERWIRDTQQALAQARLPGYDVLPLYARLTASRQDRIFKPGRTPRIVLATNVAETSLTVPRIRFVVDSGLARISRYSARHRVQGLAVEPIAQANAVQRAGRCGRLAPGVCVRLYAEDDFDARAAFTDPEILRTNLAGVILRLEALGLGHIDEFPFLDAPPERAVNDAYRLLHLLGALDADGRLTKRGRAMARLPLDPRLARMLVAAREHGALGELLVITAAMSIVDPRERPPEAAEAARREQDKLADPRSDFLTYLNLWQAWQQERRQGARAARAFCESHFLSVARMREWEDVRSQLAELVRSLGWRSRERAGAADYRTVHRCVLAAFVDHVAERDERREYRGVHDSRAMLFPGTALARKAPRWIVAGERLATERPWLRTVAGINPRWIVEAAPHLVKREWRDPLWDKRRGRVTALEVVSLFGLVLSADRRVDYARVDPAAAREIFIRDALAADDLGRDMSFLVHNRRLRTELLDWEARIRARDLYAGERAAAAFYRERLPGTLSDRTGLERWCRQDGDLALRMSFDDMATRDPATLDATRYPLVLEVAGHALALRYCYDPASEHDGISVSVPLALLNAIRPSVLEWLVPGWLAEKLTGMLRALPKAVRRPLVPLPDTVAALVAEFADFDRGQPLAEALSTALHRRFGVSIDPGAFDPSAVPRHLLMRIEVIEQHGRVIASGRDLVVLQRSLAGSSAGVRSSVRGEQRGASRWQRQGMRDWDCDDLPDAVPVSQHGQRLRLYPALVEENDRVDLRLLPPGPAAGQLHRRGVRRLLLKSLAQQCALLRQRVLGDRGLLLSLHGISSGNELADDVLCASAEDCFALDPLIRTRDRFASVLATGRAGFVPAGERLLVLARELLAAQRTLRRRIEALQGRLDDAARADLLAQLDGLFQARFLSETPSEWRVHLPRYLKAMGIRLDKIEQRHPKDAEYQGRILAAAGRLQAWLQSHPPGWPWPPAVVRYRWLLEEFRVSLFAQPLGTALPVSEKRLAAAWQAAVRNSAG